MRFLFKTHYRQDIKLFKHNGQRLWYGLLLAAVMLAPALLDSFYLGELAFVYIYAIAGVGLMLLVGYTGMVSLGHAAFLAIGGYAHAWMMTHGWPLPLSLITSALLTGCVGAAVGLPATRMTGNYLAIATLAFSFIVASAWQQCRRVCGRSVCSTTRVVRAPPIKASSHLQITVRSPAQRGSRDVRLADRRSDSRPTRGDTLHAWY